MAKALLGYVGGPDPRLVTEVRRLQRRVHDLEAEVQRLQAENDVLVENVDGAHIALEELPAPEPVLA
jgi:cell division protein FtsB